MLKFIDRLPNEKTSKIYRVVAFEDDKSRDAFIQSMKNGDEQKRTVASWTAESPYKDGVASMSHIGMDVASQYGDKRVILTLNKPKTAKDISFIYSKDASSGKGGELVTTMGTKLKVTKSEERDGDHHIEMEEA